MCVQKASDARADLVYTHAYGMSLHACDGVYILIASFQRDCVPGIVLN